MESNSLQADAGEILRELKRANEFLARNVKNQRDWKLAFRQGMAAGLGGVIGATLLVSLLLWLLQPLKHLGVLKPTLDRIADQLERVPKK